MSETRRWTRRRARLAVTGGLLVTWVAGWGITLGAAELVDRVLAVVSGTVITLSDARMAIELGAVDTTGAPDAVAVALRWLIDRQLVLDEVNRYNASEVEAPRVADAVAKIRARYASDRAFADALARFGLDQAGLRAWVRESERMEQYVVQRFDAAFPATDEELRDYFTRHQARFSRGGVAPTFEEVRETVRAAVQQERRSEAVESWMARLRRRAEVNELYLPVR